MTPVVLEVPERVEEPGQRSQVFEDEVPLPEHVKGELQIRRAIGLFARGKVPVNFFLSALVPFIKVRQEDDHNKQLTKQHCR